VPVQWLLLQVVVSRPRGCFLSAQRYARLFLQQEHPHESFRKASTLEPGPWSQLSGSSPARLRSGTNFSCSVPSIALPPLTLTPGERLSLYRRTSCMASSSDPFEWPACTGEFPDVEQNVRFVHLLLDRRLAAAVFGHKVGALVEDIAVCVRQQLRLVRVGSISRVKLTVLLDLSGEGWKKETPFKRIEAPGLNPEALLIQALATLSLAWSLTNPVRSFEISAFCSDLSTYIIQRRSAGASWATLGTYYGAVMLRVDGTTGDLQRGEGPIARPVPQIAWIDGRSQQHVDRLVQQVLDDGCATDQADLHALEKKLAAFGNSDGKRRSDGASGATLTKKQKKDAASQKKRDAGKPCPLLLGFTPTVGSASALSACAAGRPPTRDSIKAQLLHDLGKDGKGRSPCFFHHHLKACRFDNDVCFFWHSK